jgi:hypothetical protein
LWSLFLLGLAAASAPAGAAETQAPKPGQVIGYAKADRSGASQIWALPDDKPYLYVPSIPAHLGGALARVETGAEIGAALFQGPYFTARDQGCLPVLGVPGRPDMAWLGATAHFVPTLPGQPEPTAGAKEARYASMILFRADLGPPPGVLLLERRPTAGLHCTNPVHATLYNRIFVPIAEAPSKTRCFELVGNYPSGETSGTGKAFALDFLGAERAALLAPGDMAVRYAEIQHRVVVTLFDGLSCKGASLTLNSRADDAKGILRLAQAGYRGRVRSVRLIYEGGNAEAFMVAGEKTAEASQVQTPAPSPSPNPAAASAVLSTQAGPDPKPSLSAAATEKAETAKPTQAADTPLAVSAKAVQPPVQPAVQAATPAQAPKSVQPSQATGPILGVEPLADGLLATPAAKAGAFAVQASNSGGTKTFAYPVQDLYRLNHCLYWQKDCGAAAAQTWCQAKGFATAVDWRIDESIGASFPTLVMGEKKICASDQCDGFRSITCGH